MIYAAGSPEGRIEATIRASLPSDLFPEEYGYAALAELVTERDRYRQALYEIAERDGVPMAGYEAFQRTQKIAREALS